MTTKTKSKKPAAKSRKPKLNAFYLDANSWGVFRGPIYPTAGIALGEAPTGEFCLEGYGWGLYVREQTDDGEHNLSSDGEQEEFYRFLKHAATVIGYGRDSIAECPDKPSDIAFLMVPIDSGYRKLAGRYCLLSLAPAFERI